MKAIVVTDQAAGTAGMTLVDRPEPGAGRSRHRLGYGTTGVSVGQRAFNPTERISGQTIIRVRP